MPVYNVDINHLTQIYQNTRIQELETLGTFMDQVYSLCLNLTSTSRVSKIYGSVLLILFQEENSMCDPLVTVPYLKPP